MLRYSSEEQRGNMLPTYACSLRSKLQSERASCMIVFSKKKREKQLNSPSGRFSHSRAGVRGRSGSLGSIMGPGAAEEEEEKSKFESF